MGFAYWLGCVLVAFSVPLLLFIFIVCRKPQLVLIFISSAFLWISSVIILSVIWFAIPPLRNGGFPALVLSFAVLAQEAARYTLILSYARIEKTFSATSTNVVVYPLSDLTASLSAGVGFGVMQTFVVYGSILVGAYGPGILVNDHCPETSIFVISSWIALFMNILHICLMIIALDAYRRKSKLMAAFVVVLHALATLLTLLNKTSGGCISSIISIACVSLFSLLATWKVIHKADYRGKIRI